MSSKPFDGIRVVEFGQFIAVPYCAQLLADGGAYVVKVESLEGDPTRHLAPLAPGETRHFISRNRGKHSLPLDLKHPQAQRIIDALIADADVVLTNLRPGLAQQLGLDYAALSQQYPRLVVGNVTAFGHKGPDATLAGMDLMMQARSGLMAANGRTQNGLPMAGDPPIIDYMCAMMLAFGVSSALLRREHTGNGGEVDVALLMAALVLQNNLIMRVESVDGGQRGRPPRHRRVARAVAQVGAQPLDDFDGLGIVTPGDREPRPVDVEKQRGVGAGRCSPLGQCGDIALQITVDLVPGLLIHARLTHAIGSPGRPVSPISLTPHGNRLWCARQAFRDRSAPGRPRSSLSAST